MSELKVYIEPAFHTFNYPSHQTLPH